MRTAHSSIAPLLSILVGVGSTLAASAEPKPPETSYRPLPSQPPDVVRRNDEAQKPDVMRRQQALLQERYDLSDRPIANLKMSGGRRAVQGGVRVKLPAGASWPELAAMNPAQIRQRNLLPAGFQPLPHVKQKTGGQVFPQQQIDRIKHEEARDLGRFDVDFDLPERFTPEFPRPFS